MLLIPIAFLWYIFSLFLETNEWNVKQKTDNSQANFIQIQKLSSFYFVKNSKNSFFLRLEC